MRVRLTDGRTINVEGTNDPAQAERAVQRFLREERQRASPEYAGARRRVENRQQQMRNSPVRQTPVLGPLVQGLQDFTDQMATNLGVSDELSGGAEFARQGVENLVRRARGQQIETPANIAYMAAADVESERGARTAQERPILNAASLASAVAAAGNPVQNPGRITALQAGAGAAAANAPFAVARQEGNLAERAPGALTETAIVGPLAMAGQSIANAASRRGAQNASRMADFDAANVRPTLAAVTGAGPLTKAIAENPAGGNVRRALQNSIDDTERGASRVASQYGRAASPETTGEAVQEGVERFARDRTQAPPGGNVRAPARDWSFAAKAEHLYDLVLTRIQQAENILRRGGTAGGRRMIGNPRIVTATRTQQTLDDILGAVSDPAIASIVHDPDIVRFAQALRRADPTFADLRAFRTHVRGLQGSGRQLRQGVDDAGLQRLEAALTDDIMASAHNIGGPRAVQALGRVDRFYRAGQQRIQNALQPFANRNPAAAYDRIIQLASDRGATRNVAALTALRRSLRPEEFRNVAASVIERMGRAEGGTSFSVENFVRAYDRLSPEGREALFGGATRELMDELDTLARVARSQQQIEQFANRSRSGSSVQNVTTLTALGGSGVTALAGNPLPLMGVLGGLGAMRLTGEALTNPAFVRWLAGASRARAAGAGDWGRHVRALNNLATRDPALTPIYSELVRGLDQQSSARSAPQQRQPALAQ